MRICHVSDLHWGFVDLPPADLYVSTGDMYANYYSPIKLTKRAKAELDYMGVPAHVGHGRLDAKYNKEMQERAAKNYLNKVHGGFRRLLGSPNSPILCVRGNHDFTDAYHLFEGCNLIKEFICNEVVEFEVPVAGGKSVVLKATGHRGVPPINGAWADEMPVPDLADRIHSMDHTCDLYLTHYPPAGLGLDLPGHWGVGALSNWLTYNASKPHPLHMHGHIHECGGKVVKAGTVTFSNAATTYVLLEGNPEIGWKDVSPP